MKRSSSLRLGRSFTDMRIAAAILLLCVAGVVGGQPSSNNVAASCSNCGVITSIRMTTQEEEWAPIGIVHSAGVSSVHPTGAATRSALEIGSEGSRGVVVVGAAGGASYSRPTNSYQRPRWGVTVKMDDGGTRTVQQRYEPFVREGDRVRILGTQLELVD